MRRCLLFFGSSVTIIGLHEGYYIRQKRLNKLWIQNQHIFSFYTQINNQLMAHVPIDFQTQKMWDTYAYKMIEQGCHANTLKDIPDIFQTQKIWDTYACGTTNISELSIIPEKFQHQTMWELYVKKNQQLIYIHGFQQIPKKFRTDNFYNNALAMTIRVLPHVPEHLRTPELWRDYLRKVGIIGACDVPKKIFTQDFCEKVIPEMPWLIGHVPHKHVTLKICQNIGRFSEGIRYIPKKYIDEYLNQLPIDFFVAENLHYMNGTEMPVTIFNKYFKSINFGKTVDNNDYFILIQDNYSRTPAIPDDRFVIFEKDQIKVSKLCRSII